MKIFSMGENGDRLLLEKTEAIIHCNLGQGAKTCCYVAHGPEGFECLYKNKKMRQEIVKLSKENKMVARWTGCKWNWIKSDGGT